MRRCSIARLAYHYTINEWVPLTIDTAAIFAMGSPAYDMDAMDTAFPDMDAITIDMDSRFWSGGEPQLFAIGSDLKGGYFSGPNLAATLETGTVNSPRGALFAA
jgi:hypothetical protein